MARRRGRPSNDRNDRRRSHCSVDKPALCHFFKIILATTIEENKLHIPCKFVDRFGDELTDVADLIVPNGSVWKVGLSKAGDDIWFDDGWQKFAEHHSICNGHLLVFAYTGSCSFNVCIFDMSAYEIEYPCNNDDPNCDENGRIRNEVEMQDDIPSEMLDSIISSPPNRSSKSKLRNASATKRDSTQTHTQSEPKLRMKRSRGTSTASRENPDSEHRGKRMKRREVERSVEKIDVDDNEKGRRKLGKGKPSLSDEQKTRRMTLRSGKTDVSAECEEKETQIITSSRFKRMKVTPGSKRAICAAKKYISKNPSFMVMLTAYNSHIDNMYVTFRFTRYLKGLSRIKLQVPGGGEWEVQLHGRDKRRSFGVGWRAFCSDNDLDEGDVCVFELMKKEVLKVEIFHAI